jgi:hypothetical protein
MTQKLVSGSFIQDEQGRPMRPQAVASVSDPSVNYPPVTPSSTPLAGGACRAILVETAGRLKLTQPDGTARDNVPMIVGYNPLGASVIDAPGSGTAATGVFAIY